MHQNWNGELQDADDKEEYIQEKDPKKISAYLKAEEQYKNKAHEESILKIIDDKQTSPAPKATPTATAPKFIQDDRERTYIKQQGKPESSLTSAKNQQNKETNNKPKYQAAKQDQRDKKPKYYSKDAKKINENIPETSSKKITYVEKTRDEPDPKKKGEPGSNKRKYVEKKPEKMRRKQFQTKNGQEIEIELLADDDQYENEIYVGKRDVGIYFQKARELIQQYEFIVLKSYALYVSKTFLVAGLMGRQFPQLKQINIPSTVDVLIHSKKGKRQRIRGSIRIELSLHELNSSHIGYQQVPKKTDTSVKHQPKETKIQYKEKKQQKIEYREKREDQKDYREKPRQRKYQDKRKVYPANKPRRQQRKWHEESSEEKERALR